MSELSLFSQDNKLERSITVQVDEFTELASKMFDYEFDGTTRFKAWGMPDIPDEFGIGLIVGASGSGKSTLLKEFGEVKEHVWDPKKAIVSQFATPDEAMERLQAVGLNTVPAWLRPYHVLSGGEKFRAELARTVQNNCVIDEYTSVVNRNVAKSCSVALSRYVKRNKLQKVVLASCHYDIIDWLEPDWVFSTDTGEFTVRRGLRRPEVQISIYHCERNIWPLFAPHHYLRHDLNEASRCYLAIWENEGNPEIIGFTATLPLPSGSLRNAWREHRTVILPDFQGLGLGPRLSNAVGEIMLARGLSFYSRTAHPRLGAYRNASPLWRATTSSEKIQKGNNKGKLAGKWIFDDKRICFSHQYLGEKS